MLMRMGAAIEGIGSNVMHVHGVATARRLRARRLARPHRDRLVHGAGRRDRRRAAHQGQRPRRPAHDPARLQPARPALRARRRRRRRPRRPEARHGARRRRLPDQGRGRPVAGVPGRPHLDRRRARHAVRGLRADLREDVREPPVLHGQAGRDGRQHHPLRPAPRDRHRPARGCAAQRVVLARHPGRHGDADRRAVRRGRDRDRQHPQIDRGYERIDERLRALGARIERQVA